MTTKSIVPFFNDKFGKLRTIEKNNEPMFAAVDVCKSLEIKNNRQAVSKLENDERFTVTINDGESRTGHKLTFVTFSGLLSLILTSRKKEARAYKRWVTHDVLPAIHKEGAYMVAREDETPEQIMARAIKVADKTIKQQQQELEALRPKAQIAEALMPEKTSYTVTETVRYLAQINPSIKRAEVFQFLRDANMMCKQSTAPTRNGIKTGRLIATVLNYKNKKGEKKAKQVGKLTPKGVAWLAAHFTEKAVA